MTKCTTGSNAGGAAAVLPKDMGRIRTAPEIPSKGIALNAQGAVAEMVQSDLWTLGYTDEIGKIDGHYGKKSDQAAHAFLATLGSNRGQTAGITSVEIETIHKKAEDVRALAADLSQITEALIEKSPETLLGLHAAAESIRKMSGTQHDKEAAITGALEKQLTSLRALVNDGTLDACIGKAVENLSTYVATASKSDRLLGKAAALDELYAQESRGLLSQSAEQFVAALHKANEPFTKEVVDALYALASEPQGSGRSAKIGAQISKLDSVINATPSSITADSKALGEIRALWSHLKRHVDFAIDLDKGSQHGTEAQDALIAIANEAVRQQIESGSSDQAPRGERVFDKSAREYEAEMKGKWRGIADSIRDELKLGKQPSTSLSLDQIKKAFTLAAKEFGQDASTLQYTASTESGLKQTADNGAAAGLMQVERVNKDAYISRNGLDAKNDTVTNIVYGSMLRAVAERKLADEFKAVGLKPPTNPAVLDFVVDLGYNRGPGIFKYIVKFANEQAIDVNNFDEYVAGKGGTFELLNNGKLKISPAARSGVNQHGTDSVLDKALKSLKPVNLSQRLQNSVGDRNGDGVVDHLDIWVTRGIKFLAMKPQDSAASV